MSDTPFGESVLGIFANEANTQKTNAKANDDFFAEALNAVKTATRPAFDTVKLAYDQHPRIALMKITELARPREGESEILESGLYVTHQSGVVDSLIFLFNNENKKCVIMQTVKGQDFSEKTPMPCREITPKLAQGVTLTFLNRVFDKQTPRLPISKGALVSLSGS
jgi:hypothetical protein